MLLACVKTGLLRMQKRGGTLLIMKRIVEMQRLSHSYRRTFVGSSAPFRIFRQALL